MSRRIAGQLPPAMKLEDVLGNIQIDRANVNVDDLFVSDDYFTAP